MSMYGIDPEETADALDAHAEFDAATLMREMAARITDLEAKVAAQPPTDQAALRDRIVKALLAPRYGGPQHNTPGGLSLTATPEEASHHRAGQIADIVLSVLPEQAGEQPTDPATDQIERGRTQLLKAMSAVSEDRTCTGWASDWARTLHAEGGIWETLGRAVGWPTGNYDKWEWVTWDEAAAHYAAEA